MASAGGRVRCQPHERATEVASRSLQRGLAIISTPGLCLPSSARFSRARYPFVVRAPHGFGHTPLPRLFPVTMPPPPSLTTLRSSQRTGCAPALAEWRAVEEAGVARWGGEDCDSEG